MRVLYVLRYYPTLTETFVYREIEALLARGAGIRAVAIGARSDGALQDRLPCVEVGRPPRLPLSAARHLGHPEAAWGRRHLRPKDLLRALWLGDHARRLRVDRLHAHFAGEAAEWARIAAAIAGVPYSVTVHAVDLFRPRPSLEDVLRAADRVVTISAHNRAALRERHGVEAQVVRCGVEPGACLAADPAAPGPLRVIAVGRAVPKKGLDLLVEAARALPEVRFRLVSDLPDPGLPNVEVGLVPPSRVQALLASSHLFALPCRVAADGDRDGIPVALMEAMAAGLPVLTTAVSGIPELVDEEVGWLVPPDDPSALLAALREAAAPEVRARRGRAAPRRLVDRGFTTDRQADALLTAWGGR